MLFSKLQPGRGVSNTVHSGLIHHSLLEFQSGTTPPQNLAPRNAATPPSEASSTIPRPTKAERRARAEWINSQAHQSPLDRYGNVRCLSCGKVLGSYEGLAGHLVTLHDGENSEERRAREASEAVDGGRGNRRPPVMLLDGLAPVLEALPGGALNRSGGGSGKGGLGGGPSNWKSIVTEGKRPNGTRSSDFGVSAQSGEGQKGKTLNEERKSAGDKQQGATERVRVSLLAGHAAAAISGEGHRPITQGVNKDKKVANPNTAQSTGLVERRGKEREQPKKKRLSKLKKLVLQEKEMVAREGGIASLDSGGVAVQCEVRASSGGAAETPAADHLIEGGSEAGPSEGRDRERGTRGTNGCGGAETSVSGGENTVEAGGASVFKEGDGDGKTWTEAEDDMTGLVRAHKQKQEPVTYIGPNVKIRYCQQVISPELNATCFALLQELLRFQERVRAQDPAKLKMKRRLVTGFREVAKSVKTKRAGCLIVAPNIEETTEDGVLDTSLEAILGSARENGVPVVCALTRLRIAQAFGRRVRMSIVAILSFEGADEQYKRLLALAAAGRKEWEEVNGSGGL
ncbi:hypothetical protein KFL_000530420 [Klebsormidium nitens]|uniref:C2H2-type domain-containing protein n=1 Tax=Klebsormidium nitens TaxID=105231 RepID=A0A1Y1HV53_KLENI|nr:hypothetical protein KFL_000530420 [Klebsormidium nitens]|eukprot:GAQ80416.1 hypothetical protein KFL_000530420 [Klebsormidium nitens]